MSLSLKQRFNSVLSRNQYVISIRNVILYYSCVLVIVSLTVFPHFHLGLGISLSLQLHILSNHLICDILLRCSYYISLVFSTLSMTYSCTLVFCFTLAFVMRCNLHTLQLLLNAFISRVWHFISCFLFTSYTFIFYKKPSELCRW